MQDNYNDLTPANPTQSCENCRHFRYKTTGGYHEPEDTDYWCAIKSPEFDNEDNKSFEQTGFNCLSWDYYDWDEHYMREAEMEARYYNTFPTEYDEYDY